MAKNSLSLYFKKEKLAARKSLSELNLDNALETVKAISLQREWILDAAQAGRYDEVNRLKIFEEAKTAEPFHYLRTESVFVRLIEIYGLKPIEELTLQELLPYLDKCYKEIYPLYTYIQDVQNQAIANHVSLLEAKAAKYPKANQRLFFWKHHRDRIYIFFSQDEHEDILEDCIEIYADFLEPIIEELQELEVPIEQFDSSIEDKPILERGGIGLGKILWHKNKQDLAALINALIETGFVSGKNIDTIISEHFTFLNDTYSPKKMKNLRTKVRNKELSPSEDIQQIIKTKVKKGD